MAWSLLLAAHTFAAVLALILGAVNLRRKPRGDRFHKQVGYVWVLLMYWVAISSFWLRDLNDGRLSWIHGLSVLTLVTLTLGIVYAVRGNIRAHRGMMRGTYFGLVGAGVGAAAVPSRALPQLVWNEPMTALVAAGLVAVSAVVILLVLRARAGNAILGKTRASTINGTERI